MKKPAPRSVLARKPPADAPAEAVERIAPRRLQLETGDVVFSRELLPRVNPHPASQELQWRFRVCVEGQPGSSQFFTGFAAAGAHAEDLANRLRARLMFVEDDFPSLLADHRGPERLLN